MRTLTGFAWLAVTIAVSTIRRITCRHESLDVPRVYCGASNIIWKRRCLRCGANIVEGVP
jgi:hypothetical protein